MPRKKKSEQIEESKTIDAVETSEKQMKEDKVETLEKQIKEYPDTDLSIDIFSQQGGASTEPAAQSETPEHKHDDLKKKLLDKAKKLAEKIEIKDKKDITGQVKLTAAEKKRKRAEKALFPLDDYVKYSAQLGTKAITPKMRKYVYRRRADGIAVLNTYDIDAKLKEACEFLAKFNPEDIFLACKREAGWPAALKFLEVTGIRVFTKKYPAGIITNFNLENFFETELVIICDPWLDKNALNDAIRMKRQVIGLCDTNNLTTGLDKLIPCNNKSGKSIGLIFYLLAREYLKARGKEKEARELNLDDFAGKIEELKARTYKSQADEAIAMIEARDAKEETKEEIKEAKEAKAEVNPEVKEGV